MGDDAMHEAAGEIFLAALRMPEEERVAYLREACGDRDLLSAVRELLAHDVVDEHSPTSVSKRSSSPRPECIGDYRVLDEIGRGGAGVVYRAHQESLGRTVALKLLPPGPSSDACARRLEIEARVLAMLDHPGIARVFESGVHPTPFGDRPFLAMEIIHGRDITGFCRERDLDVSGRLRLLADICDATHHAHQRGILHRDLKPQNILVTEHGEPKVLDFGLARSLDVAMGVTTLDEQANALLGTVGYMAPEALLHGVEAATVRTDVYALGLIGYELLAGHLPVAIEGHGFAEIVQLVTSEAAPRLGTVDARLSGDVEAVFAKALEKDPVRRYGSAQELGRDVRALAAGETVTARRPGLLQRIRRSVRQHALAVSSTALVIVTLLLIMALQLNTNLEFTDEFARRELFAKTLIEFFNTPVAGSGGEATLQEHLAKAGDFITSELADQPDVAAMMHHFVGRIIAAGALDLEGRERAREHLGVAESLAISAFEGPDQRVFSRMLTEIDRRLGEGDLEGAGAIMATLDEQRESVASVIDHYDLRRRVVDANVARAEGRVGDERAIIEEVYRRCGEENVDDWFTVRVGRRLARLSEPGEELMIVAELLAATTASTPRRRVLALREHHARTVLGKAADESSVAGLSGSRDDMDAVVTELTSLFGATHHQTLGARELLGAILFALGDSDAAHRVFVEAKDVALSALGPDHLTSVRIQDHLGDLYAERGQHKMAAEIWAKLIDDLSVSTVPRRERLSETKVKLDNALAAVEKGEETGQDLDLMRGR